MTPREASVSAIMAEILRVGIPTSPRATARLGARTAIIACGAPASDLDFISAAAGLAEGLNADWRLMCERDRWTWIDLCEAELRAAAREMAARAPP